MTIRIPASSRGPGFCDPLALYAAHLVQYYVSYLDTIQFTVVRAIDRGLTVLNRDNLFGNLKLERRSSIGCTAVDVVCLCCVASVPK